MLKTGKIRENVKRLESLIKVCRNFTKRALPKIIFKPIISIRLSLFRILLLSVLVRLVPVRVG